MGAGASLVSKAVKKIRGTDDQVQPMNGSPNPDGSPTNAQSRLEYAQLGNELWSLAELGDEDNMRRCLRDGAPIEHRAEWGWTPLHIAAFRGQVGAAKLLVKSNADIESKTDSSWTPMHRAAFNGHASFCAGILELNANVDARTDEGFTPLHLAAQEGQEKVIICLIDRRAEVSVQSNTGWTPLHWAAEKGHEKATSALIAARADLHARDSEGAIPLHWACGGGRLEVVTMLIHGKSNVESIDNMSQTSLHWACREQKKDVVALLLQNGAQVDPTGTGAADAKKFIAAGGQKKVLDAAALFKTQVMEKQLIKAAEQGDMRLVEQVLAKGNETQSPKSPDNPGSPSPTREGGPGRDQPLHLAVIFDRSGQIVKLLLAARADIDAPNSRGSTALEIAKGKGPSYAENQRLLLEAHLSKLLDTIDLGPEEHSEDEAPVLGRALSFYPWALPADRAYSLQPEGNSPSLPIIEDVSPRLRRASTAGTAIQREKSRASIRNRAQQKAKGPREVPELELPQDPKDESHAIGGGEFSLIFKAQRRGLQIVGKVSRLLMDGLVEGQFNETALEGPTEIALQLSNEVALLSRLHHPNLARFVGVAYTTEGPLQLPTWILTEYVAGGSLEEHIHGGDREKRHVLVGGKVRPRTALHLTDQCMKALAYLHGLSKPLVHRHIKPSNCLLSSLRIDEATLKLVDVAIPRLDREVLFLNPKYDEKYRPPEATQLGHKETPQVDLYAWGVTLIECLLQERPALTHQARVKQMGFAVEILRDSHGRGLVPLLRRWMDANPVRRSTAAAAAELSVRAEKGDFCTHQ